MYKNLIFIKFIFVITILVTLTFILRQNISIGKWSMNVTSKSKQERVDTAPFTLDNRVLAFVHIQKTGGSEFDLNIVKHLLIKNNKRRHQYVKVCTTRTNTSSSLKNYKCIRDMSSSQNWYLSRQTFGWACGLHPDITTLKNCLESWYNSDKNFTKIDYFTIIREPTQRYLSEWQHVKRGAIWLKQGPNCLIDKYKMCFGEGRMNWTNVSINEFMACKFNLASNRQTRMLTFYKDEDTLGLCDWNNGRMNEKYEKIFLERAKRTLDSMRFFAINEYQYLSQVLFERTFGGGDYGTSLFKFEVDLKQMKRSFAAIYFRNLTKTRRDELIQKIKRLNRLDFELYEYGLELFFTRLKYFKIDY
jgi:hypothetical protein